MATTAKRAEIASAPYCRYDITTTLGLIEALGGAEAVAKDLGVSASTVADWCITGDIPTGWHLRLYGRACALRKSVSPTALALPESDRAALGLGVIAKALRVYEGGIHG